MRYLVEEEVEVGGVADSLGHLSVGMLVIGGEDLMGQLGEVIHI